MFIASRQLLLKLNFVPIAEPISVRKLVVLCTNLPAKPASPCLQAFATTPACPTGRPLRPTRALSPPTRLLAPVRQTSLRQPAADRPTVDGHQVAPGPSRFWSVPEAGSVHYSAPAERRQLGSPAARQPGSSAAWQPGSSAAWQLGSLAARQLGSLAQNLQTLFTAVISIVAGL